MACSYFSLVLSLYFFVFTSMLRRKKWRWKKSQCLMGRWVFSSIITSYFFVCYFSLSLSLASFNYNIIWFAMQHCVNPHSKFIASKYSIIIKTWELIWINCNANKNPSLGYQHLSEGSRVESYREWVYVSVWTPVEWDNIENSYTSALERKRRRKRRKEKSYAIKMRTKSFFTTMD